MVSKKPRIVIIGAGMAGLTAANKLHTCPNSSHMFDLAVVEGGTRIGGRISTSEFCGDRIEQGATWIHGIDGSPVYKIAKETNSLVSEQPWECMDGIPEDPVTVAEGGYRLDRSLVDPVTELFKSLMDFVVEGQGGAELDRLMVDGNCDCESVGSFLRRGLEAYWASRGDEGGDVALGDWWRGRREVESGVFAMHESIQRTFTSADDLRTLDYKAEREYVMFPGEEITIASGYSSVVQSLASVLPAGMIRFGKRVERVEWRSDGGHGENGCGVRPVRLHFSDGSVMCADHVIVTVSLGVLKRGVGSGRDSSGGSGFRFDPPLPGPKASAISRLGYGVVNKVFLHMGERERRLPFLQMVFHGPGSEGRDPRIPGWIRRTSSLCPIYNDSRVVLSWFTGQEALELETLTDEEIVEGFSSTVANLLPPGPKIGGDALACNGNNGRDHVMFDKVLRTQWGTNPLFLGSYSYVKVGSSIDDMDTLAEPLPGNSNLDSPPLQSTPPPPPLQILFAGEATHKTHYSTTHGAYFSGLREANRLLKHYNYNGV